MKAIVLWLARALCAYSVLIAMAGFCAPVQLVSVRDSAQTPPSGGAGDSWGSIVSPDGRFILFASTAYNLALTTNGHALPVVGAQKINVFLRDRTNGSTTLVSVNIKGNGGGNGDSLPTGISTNGRYACFESSASDLVPGDVNAVADVFVRDLVQNKTVLVSVATDGTPGNGVCRGSVMTPNGRFVAFVSEANNLVAGDANGIADVFVRDLQTGATTLVSAGAVSTNAILLSSSEAPDMTPDGRYVAFYSTATNLVAGVASSGEIYVRDTVAGTTTWASTGARNLLGSTNAISYNHALSDDGQFVAYETSTNAPLAAGSTERWGLILRYSLATGLTDLVGTNAFAPPTLTHDIHSLSMTPDGRFIAYVANANDTSGATSGILLWDAQSGLSTLVSGDAGGNIPADSVCDSPLVDPTGRFVTFVSRAPGLVTNLLLGDYHVYLRDTQAGTTTLVDADTNGVGSSVSAATAPRMSGDARLVTFECLDANLVANDRNHDYDVFIHDLAENTNELISARHQALASSTANGASVTSAQCVSSDGRFVAFASEADNLVANDTNRVRDVLVRDLGLGTNILISVATNGFAGNNFSVEPALSGNGRYVAFTSAADNLVPGDTNANPDVFVRDLVAGTTTLVSVRTDGNGSGNRGSSSPLIGADGRFVLFVSGATNLAIGTFSVGSVNLFLRDTVSNVTYALTTNGVAAVDMTPDGRFIVFNARSGLNGSIYVWDSQLEARVYTITTNATWLAISADGNRIAYVAGVGTFIADRGVNTTWQAGAAARRGMRLNYDGRFLAFSAGPNNTNQVYLYDSQTGATNLVSHDSSLNPTFGKSGPLAISPDGRFVVYRSTATNIVALLDKNLQADLFLYDRFTGSNNPVTTSLYQRSTADGFSTGPVISGDGLTMVFQSYASDVGMGDFNDNSDLFAETFLFVTISNAPGQGPTLSWTTRPGESYHAQFKDDVRNVNWQQVVGTIAFAGNQAHVTDLAPSAAQRFYRVVGF